MTLLPDEKVEAYKYGVRAIFVVEIYARTKYVHENNKILDILSIPANKSAFIVKLEELKTKALTRRFDKKLQGNICVSLMQCGPCRVEISATFLLYSISGRITLKSF